MAGVKAAVGYKYGRLVEQSGGMVDSVVHPALLKDSEARLLKNVALGEKGTIKTTLGRQERFGVPFDVNSPCNGIAAFYPDTTTSRLVIGAGTKLYKDTPHLIQEWDSESEWGAWTSSGLDKTGGNLSIAKDYGIKSLGTMTAAESGSTEYERGWMFTVGAKDVMVTGLRVYGGKAGSVSAKLWKMSDQSKLKEVSITAVVDKWVEATFAPITLNTGAAYIVSINVPKETTYKQTAKSANTYNSLITCNDGRYTTTQGNFPASADGNNIFGLVDLNIFMKGAATETVHTSQADWEAQTRSGLNTAISPGNVVLARAGSDFTETDSTRAEFAAGVLSDVWAAEEGLQLETATIRTWNDFSGASWEDLA